MSHDIIGQKAQENARSVLRGGCARVIVKFCGMQFKLSRSISNVLFLLTQRVELG